MRNQHHPPVMNPRGKPLVDVVGRVGLEPTTHGLWVALRVSVEYQMMTLSRPFATSVSVGNRRNPRCSGEFLG